METLELCWIFFFGITIVAICKMILSSGTYTWLAIYNTNIVTDNWHDATLQIWYAIVTSIIRLDLEHAAPVISNCSSVDYYVIIWNAFDTCWPSLFVSSSCSLNLDHDQNCDRCNNRNLIETLLLHSYHHIKFIWISISVDLFAHILHNKHRIFLVIIWNIYS